MFIAHTGYLELFDLVVKHILPGMGLFLSLIHIYVQLADEAVCVGGPRPQDSYLNMQNILAAAVGTGVQAIHPGFGFLSENSQFAEMCQECGITFIGPQAQTIDLMGNKEHARQQMKKIGVPVIPGSDSYINNVNEAIEVADRIGYPVLIKAAAGGGGKGIRRVTDAQEMKAAFHEAQSEARLSFDNDQMYIEKIMENVKHIEMQIFRDRFGHSVYFPERDCSLQINKQKVLEESPCKLITPTERKELGQIALRAVNGIDYLNTGTLEFLMDQDHHFYFMEMNTRIQVEHTVTEMVTGIDIVKAQVRVAAGAPLPFDQSDIQLQGAAIECRINAEDAEHGFIPSTGQVKYLYLPVGNLGMRIDTALYQGATVTPFYDSMIAKVIALGHNREEAIEKIKRLLNEMVIVGINTNQTFQQALLTDPNFISGQFSTAYLEKQFLPLWKERISQDEPVRSK